MHSKTKKGDGLAAIKPASIMITCKEHNKGKAFAFCVESFKYNS